MRPESNYPDVARLIGKAVEDNSNLSKKEIAGETRMSTTQLWKYERGIELPPVDTIKRMAEVLYKDPRERLAFEKGLMNARARVADLGRHRAAIDRLMSGGELRISTFPFPPFSGADDGFFDTIIARLFGLGALKITNQPVVQSAGRKQISVDIREALWNDSIDIAIGFFASLYQAVAVDFLLTPIRVCLGAVIHERHKIEASRTLVEDVLTRRRDKSLRVRPIVVAQDVGAIHVLETLKYKPESGETIIIEDLDPKQLSDALKQEIAKGDTAKNKEPVIPVIVVNEFTSFEVLKKLNGAGIPVMPLSSRKAARETPRRELPAYFLSIGCSRRQVELRNMITQLLVLLLGTEVESSSVALHTLHAKLMKRLEEVAEYYDLGKGESDESKANRFLAAYNTCLYCLALDRYSIENFSNSGLPWKSIWKRTRERVLADLWEGSKEVDAASWADSIIAYINYITGSKDEPISESEFKKLMESLDLELNLTDTQNEYVLEDRAILLRTIQNSLKELPVPLPIEYDESGQLLPGGHMDFVSDLIRGDVADIRVLNGFLTDIEALYRSHIPHQRSDHQVTKELEGMNPLERIEWFREHEFGKTFGQKKDESAILASIGKDARRYLGSAFLRPYPIEENECLELFYLWAHPNYRNLAIGEQIIRAAKDFAKGHRYGYLVVEVIRTLNDAVRYFYKRGFTESHKYSEKRPGRLVMLCKL